MPRDRPSAPYDRMASHPISVGEVCCQVCAAGRLGAGEARRVSTLRHHFSSQQHVLSASAAAFTVQLRGVVALHADVSTAGGSRVGLAPCPLSIYGR
jgi:hypothetical protein